MQHSYFAMLDLEPRFALPVDRLDVAYRSLAARVHPDRYLQASAEEQARVLKLATDANEAYRTLKKPSLRALHLLALRGMPAGETGGRLTPELLTRQLEWREALEAAREAHDPRALEQLRAKVGERAAELDARLTLELDTEPDNAAAAHSVAELMFVEKLTADVDAALALMED